MQIMHVFPEYVSSMIVYKDRCGRVVRIEELLVSQEFEPRQLTPMVSLRCDLSLLLVLS